MLVDEHKEPNILLVGGPRALSGSVDRVHFTQQPDAPVKLLNGNRYEHFEPTQRTAQVDGRRLLVFEWSSFTAVAE